MEVESVLNKRHPPAPFPIHSSSCLLLLCDGIGKKIPVPLPSLLLCYHCPQQISLHPSVSPDPLTIGVKTKLFPLDVWYH